MKNVRISLSKTLSVFMFFTAYFFILLYTLFPFLKSSFTLNPVVYWFVTGYFLFIPIFIYAVISVISEGNRSLKEIITALSIKPLSKRDLIYSTAGLISVFLLTASIFGISIILNKYYGIRLLSTTPWFMKIQPLKGSEIFLLLIWLPMFFFNIAGEEILWRGYIQKRFKEKSSWAVCSLLWMLFHLPFGTDLMIILIPVIIIIPYIFSKTENSLTGIFIHGLFNGPIFILAASGIIG